MTLLTERVQIGDEVVTGEDDYGNDVTELVWSDPVPAWLEQVNSLENSGELNQEQTTANMRLYVDIDTPIRHTSLVRWAGDDWTVQGRPGRQPGGFEVPGFRVAIIQLVEEA